MRVIELASGKVVKAFEGHTSYVLGVAWKRDSRTLASAGADKVIKVWDFVTGERKKNIEGAEKEVTAIAFVGATGDAVAELQKCIQLTTGTELTVVKDEIKEPALIVGEKDSSLPAEGLRIKTSANRVELVDQNPLNSWAIYEFLERYVGVRCPSAVNIFNYRE